MFVNLDWEIVETPVLYMKKGGAECIENKTHKCIYRNDDPERVLSVMRNSYNPMYNVDFKESVSRMLDISKFDFLGYQELKEGRVILAFLENNIDDFEINGNKIKDYQVLGTSHDGTNSFFVGTSTKLIRCMNIFSKINQINKVRHTKSSPIKREILFKYFENYFEQRKVLYDNFNKFIRCEIDEELKERCIQYVANLNLEERLYSKSLERYDLLKSCVKEETDDLGNNLFGLFQGITKYTTHKMESKMEGGFGNLFGTRADMNKKAYDFCLEYV